MLLTLLLTSVWSCQKVNDLEDADVVTADGAEFAIPLLKATTSIEDLLEGFEDYTFVEITPDGVIHLRYKGDVLSQQAEEFFLETREKLPPIIPLEDTLYALPFSAPKQLEVDYATFKAGTIGLALLSDYVGKVDLTVTMLQAVKNGQPLKIHTQFQSPIGTQPVFFYYPPEVAETKGYDLIPQNGELKIRYEALTENGERLKLPFVALVNKNIDFSYIEGYLGNFKHKGKRDSIGIEFFKDWIQGDVYFENPVIQIQIDNAFGVPTRSSIDIFDILTADGRRIPLQSDFITSTGIDFVYPANHETGQTKSMIFTFNANNSNIEEVLGSRPVALDYKVDAIMNPDSLVNERGFITDSSYYRLQLEVDLPLHGRASGFGIQDTFDVDFGSYGDVKEVEFKMVADNNMPLGIEGQIYFLDENNAILDSLFDGRKEIIVAAPVDAEGNVTSEIARTNFATFSSVRFDKIRPSKKLALKAWFSTTNGGQQSVKAVSGQDVEIRMGMRIKTG
jgi:hypothetical protein